MMNFIMLIIAIYLGLVAASLTVIVIATSKWYINRCKKLTEEIVKDYEDL